MSHRQEENKSRDLLTESVIDGKIQFIIMTELLKLPEFLEKQSKSSSGIMLIIVCIAMGVGSLLIYVSMIGIQIKATVLSMLGAMIISLSFFALVLLCSKLYIYEEKLRFQRLYLNTIQRKVNELNLRIKLMEYNEKAIAYNEKNKTPKMDILDRSDLTDMITKAIPG